MSMSGWWYNARMKKFLSKFQTFGYVFAKSLTSLRWYHDLFTADLSFSVKYLVCLVAVASFVIAFGTNVTDIPTLRTQSAQIANLAQASYPADLVITIQKGVWDINRPQPFVVSMPAQLAFIFESSAPIQNLIVFDKAGVVTDLAKYNTVFLVNEKNLLTQKGSNVQTTPLSEVSDLNVDKNSFGKAMQLLAYVWIPLIALEIALAWFGISIAFVVGQIANVLLASVAAFLLLAFLRRKLRFADVVKVAIHAATLPIVLETMLGLVPVETYSGLVTLILHLGLTGYIVYKLASLAQLPEIAQPEIKG